MVAGTITIHNVIDEVALALRDTGRSLFTDDEDYYSFILPHMVGEAQTFVFTERLPGYFLYSESKTHFLYPATPFTAESGITYQLHCKGTIRVTVGTHAGGDISVTAVQVDFNEIMVDVLMYLATHRAQEASVVLGDGSMNVEDTQRKWMEMAEFYRGVHSA
jgi:hypothetical protein